MKRSKKVASMAVAMVAVLAIGGTFAYYTAEHEIDNTMETGTYGDQVTEVFTPDSNWEPGEEADKIVGVTNTGDYDIVVRVSMSETWTFSDEEGDSLTIDSDDSAFIIASASEGDQLSKIDGLVDDSVDTTLGSVENTLETDGSVVYKELAESDWTYNENDGYWYYNSILASGKSTGALLSSITLAEDTDMGVYDEVVSYVVTTSDELVGDETWVVLGSEADTANTDVQDPDLANVVVADGYYLHVKSVSTITTGYEGYAGATYVLTITSETCQATDEAILATFTEAGTVPDTVTWFPTVK